MIIVCVCGNGSGHLEKKTTAENQQNSCNTDPLCRKALPKGRNSLHRQGQVKRKSAIAWIYPIKTHLSRLPKQGGKEVSWVWGKAHLPTWEMAGSQQTSLISVSGAELKTTCLGLWLVTHLQLRWNLRSLHKDKSLDFVDVEQHLPDIC